MTRVLCALIPVILLTAVPAQAQVTELPENAVHGLMRVTLANTAKRECPGAEVSDKRLQDEMVAVLGGLAKEGLDPVAAVQFLETEDGQKLMATQEADLRTKHGVDAKGYPALCEAIRLELDEDAALARIVTLK